MAFVGLMCSNPWVLSGVA